MTTIETVHIRNQGAYEYGTHYENLCALQDTVPVQAVKNHLAEGVLDLNSDKIRHTDWDPIFKCLRINKILQFVAFRSYYDLRSSDDTVAAKKKVPACHSKNITYPMCRSLKECLRTTQSLTFIELQGLPLRVRDVTALAKGIASNFTLRALTLEYCHIGDKSAEVLCEGVKNACCLSSLNLTGCNLTADSAKRLARLVKHQAMMRHSESWKSSLRYRVPNLDLMPGLRRLTLNRNPMVGDESATEFSEALKDDLWLKALDLQQCGISDTGALCLLNSLNFNTTLVVLDIRGNPLVSRANLQKVMEQVFINSNGDNTGYKWIRSKEPVDPSSVKSAHVRKYYKVVKKASKAPCRIVVKRSKPVLLVRQQKGMPWRTAMRALHHRDHSPIREELGLEEEEEESESGEGRGNQALQVNTSHDITVTTKSNEADETTPTPTFINDLDVKKLMIELEQARRQLKAEVKERKLMESNLLQLARENRRLKFELGEAKSRSTINIDDEFLSSVEQSFNKFNSFLDIIREAGLGQLITLAGVDHSFLPGRDRPAPSGPSDAHPTRDGSNPGLRLSGTKNGHRDVDGDVRENLRLSEEVTGSMAAAHLSTGSSGVSRSMQQNEEDGGADGDGPLSTIDLQNQLNVEDLIGEEADALEEAEIKQPATPAQKPRPKKSAKSKAPSLSKVQ